MTRSFELLAEIEVSCWETEHFKTLTQVCRASAVADHSTSTGRNIKWDHFKILASGQCGLHC